MKKVLNKKLNQILFNMRKEFYPCDRKEIENIEYRNRKEINRKYGYRNRNRE